MLYSTTKIMDQKQVTNSSEKVLKQVRFAIDTCHHPMMIDMSKFHITSEFNDELFGMYEGTFIGVSKLA